MSSFTYNDMEFTVAKVGNAWDITNTTGGKPTVVAAGLFAGLSDSDAEAKGKVLVKTIFPVGVKVVGPAVANPLTVGDIKYFPPDIAHPNFVYWDKDSSSSPKQL